MVATLTSVVTWSGPAMDATATTAAATSDNVVIQWNEAVLEGVRRSKLGPPMVSRALAVIHTCLFDAWAAYDPHAAGTGLGGTLRRPSRDHTVANKEKAISFAVYRAAAELLPAGTAVFNDLMGRLGYDESNTTTDVRDPAGVGNVACRAVLESRRRDGSNQLGDDPGGTPGVPYSDYSGYVPANDPMDLRAPFATGTFDPATVRDPDRWQPLRYIDAGGADVTPKFIGGHWNRVVPFALKSKDQFRARTSPVTFGTQEYVDQAQAVLDVSANLTDQQKVIAEYWADGPKTETPPGHWNLFAQFVSRRDGHSLDDDAKMFFALTNAIFDAGVVAWDNKIAFDSVRPITAIRHLFKGQQVRAWAGPNKGTQWIDGGDWLPYQPSTFPTPPFSEYSSGHSSFSAAGAEILRLFTGSDDLDLSVTIPAGTSAVEPGSVPATDTTLSWPTFSAAADEAGISRRYGGIHFERGDVEGRASGREAAAQAWVKAQAYINGGTGTTDRVSVASDGTEANQGSFVGGMSAQGRYVAFHSHAANLVPGDTNNLADIFVHDSTIGVTTRVSVPSGGGQGSGFSTSPVMSADGRYVAFRSFAPDLAAGDTNNAPDIFVHDRTTGATTRVSVAGDGTEASGASDAPAISGDGRYVAFESDAANLVAGDDNRTTDVFVHDRDTATTTRVSVSSAIPLEDGLGPSTDPDVSEDGRYIAFTSSAPNLVTGDTNNADDVFVRDTVAGTTTRVSVASGGTEAGPFRQWRPAISLDGRFVAFDSQSPNLVSDDTNEAEDIFVHDRTSGTTTRASMAADGSQANGASRQAAMTPDGRHVAFSSRATNLVVSDTNDGEDVFVRDLRNGAISRVSEATDGTEGDRSSMGTSISDDGRYVAFGSTASNLVAVDANNVVDVFVRDTRGAPELPLVSVGDVAVHEGNSGTRTAMFTVSLSRPARPVTVAYATVTGSAGTGDFTTKSGTLSFVGGVTSLTIKVPVSGDTTAEGDENFTLVLSSPTTAFIADSVGLATIVDDDPTTVIGRRLAVGDVAVHEGDGGQQVAVFNVSLSKASTSPVTVNFATAKGSAVGNDFTGTWGTLSFAPGATSKSVKVAITPDTAFEGDETLTLKLSAAGGATIVDGVGLGTIIDND